MWAVLTGFVALVLIALVALVLVFAFNPADQEEKTGCLVTIYDGGLTKTIRTDVRTVAGALEEAGISVQDADTVEPSTDSFLIAESYSVNIYRARPIAVRDGASATRIVTAAQTGRTVAQAANIELDFEDVVVFAPNLDVLQYDSAIILATVRRAVPVRLVLYGQENNLKTQAKTVAEFIVEKGLNVADDDSVIPSRETPITPGMEIRIWREGINTVTLAQEIPFETRTVQSNDLLMGYEKIDVAGQNGRKSVTYEIEMRSGVEVGRKEIQSVVIQEPTTQVKLVGIKAPNFATGSHEDWMRAAGISPSDFGYVNFIISRESGWGYLKWNYSGSGAYGLCQALPGSKMASAGADWQTNPITQLRWCNGYAISRYGSWAGAYNFWINHHWW